MIADGTTAAVSYPWLFAFPAGLLVLIILAANLVGDGLRDALDPDAREGPDERPGPAASSDLHVTFPAGTATCARCAASSYDARAAGRSWASSASPGRASRPAPRPSWGCCPESAG